MAETEWTHIKKIKATKQGNSVMFNPTAKFLGKGSIDKWYELKFRALDKAPTIEEQRNLKRQIIQDAVDRSYDEAEAHAFAHLCKRHKFPELNTTENLEKYTKILADTKEAFLKIRKEKLAEFLKSDLNCSEANENDMREDIFANNLIWYLFWDVAKSLPQYDKGLVEIAMMDLRDKVTETFTEELMQSSLKMAKKHQRLILSKTEKKEREWDDHKKEILKQAQEEQDYIDG